MKNKKYCENKFYKQIEKQIKILKSGKDKYKNIENKYCCKRLKWYNENTDLTNKLKGDDLEKAYNLLLLKLGISKKEAPIYKKIKNRITFHSTNFCPTLEACKILGLDTRIICIDIFEKSAEVLLQKINPKLKFTRNYKKLRPYTKYCEEMIYLVD